VKTTLALTRTPVAITVQTTFKVIKFLNLDSNPQNNSKGETKGNDKTKHTSKDSRINFNESSTHTQNNFMMKNNEFSNFNFDTSWKNPSNSITNLIDKITTLPNFNHQSNSINTNGINLSNNSKSNSFSDNNNSKYSKEAENDMETMLNIISKIKVEDSMVQDYLEQFKDKLISGNRAEDSSKIEISEFPHKKPSKNYYINLRNT
jgi:hypothetical protein